MGMFDDVVCKYPLPDCEETSFQTKDLENALFTYTITEEGRLLVEKYGLESVPEEERPYYGTKDWDDNPISHVFGSLRRVDVRTEDTCHHGDVYIYTINEQDEWIEFKIRFTEGVVSKVEKVDRKIYKDT